MTTTASDIIAPEPGAFPAKGTSWEQALHNLARGCHFAGHTAERASAASALLARLRDEPPATVEGWTAALLEKGEGFFPWEFWDAVIHELPLAKEFVALLFARAKASKSEMMIAVFARASLRVIPREILVEIVADELESGDCAAIEGLDEDPLPGKTPEEEVEEFKAARKAL